ncbi:hypothetical protein ACQPZJ_21315 [Actinoplanes sp. CA-054009]
MHTVELLLDPGLEDLVRQKWLVLREAGLPSLATHGHVSNRPHLTVATAESLAGLAGEWVPHVSLALRVPAEQRAAVPAALGDLPRAGGWFVAARSYDTATREVADLRF